MNTPIHRRRRLITSAALIFAAALGVCAQSSQGGSQNQQGPAGGKTSDDAAARKTVPKPATAGGKKPKTKPASAAGTAPKAATTSPTTGVDGIDGKWWTTGNDFGTSEVFFGRNGTLVSGAIMYADGRTGTFSGVIAGKRINFNWTNSSGDHGTGWLEQSWNNFLGGSYTNQKGASGSWTLSRIAGNWCFGGSRDRIRKVSHGSRGQLFFVTEDGGEEAGHLEGPWIFLHGEFGDIKGTMNYKANRVDFASGTYWTWCGR